MHLILECINIVPVKMLNLQKLNEYKKLYLTAQNLNML